MPTVHIPPQLRPLCDKLPQLQVTGCSLQQLIDEITVRYPRLTDRLVKDGKLAPGLAVAVDQQMGIQSLMTVIRADSEVFFLPAVGGG